MRKQYHFWPGESGLDAWDVDHLTELAADLPAEAVPLDDLPEEPDYRSCRPDELPY